MRTVESVVLFVFCFIMISGCKTTANRDTKIVQPTANRDTKIVQYLDVVFATDHAKQKLDVFRPANNPKAPLVILIHGGGWSRGERAWTYQDAIVLAQNGYAVASLGYRLVTDYPEWWKGPISGLMWNNMKSDLMHGAQYLVDHADTLGINASKAITMGSSAGGHLALVMRNRSAIWVKEGLVRRAPKIVGAVAHNPASDLKNIKNPYLRVLEKRISPEDINPCTWTPPNLKE